MEQNGRNLFKKEKITFFFIFCVKLFVMFYCRRVIVLLNETSLSER